MTAKIWSFCFALAMAASPSALAGPVEVWPSPRAVVVDAQGHATFDLVVVNTGFETAEDVVVRDALPAGTTLVAATPPPRRDGDTLVFALGDVRPGETAKARLVVSGGVDAGARLSALVGGTQRHTDALPITLLDPTVAGAVRPTLDADATDPEILALVAEHDGDPDRLAAYVRDRIGYHVYRGSLRGARGTLWTEAGNALDQASLLVALLRAAGHPARYAGATLPDAEAGALVRSMFRTPTRVAAAPLTPAQVTEALTSPQGLRLLIGARITDELLALGVPALQARFFPDPGLDPALIAAAREHFFVELHRGGAWSPIDPTRPAAPPVAATTFEEVPAHLRHTVTVALRTEHSNPLFAQFSDYAPEVERLRATVATAELAGRPLVVTHLVDSQVQSSLFAAFNRTTHTYTPVLLVDGDERATGQAHQEVFMALPGATQILTGLFVDVTMSSPGAPDVTARHELLDRLGQAARAGSIGPENAPPPPIAPGADPVLRGHEMLMLHVAPATLPSREVFSTRARLSEANDEVARVNASLPGAENLPIAQQQARMADARLWAFRANYRLAESLGFQFLDHSQRLTEHLAETMLVLAYPDRPRLAAVKTAFNEPGGAPGFDLAYDRLKVVAPQASGAHAARQFRTTRGLIESALEGEVLAQFVGPANVISLATVMRAAKAQGIHLRFLTAGNAHDLARLALPADAKARITASLRSERVVLVPETPVTMRGAPYLSWLEVDPETGDAISNDPNGMHQAWGMPLLAFRGGEALGNVIGYYGGLAIAFFDGVPLVMQTMATGKLGGEGSLSSGLDDVKADCADYQDDDGQQPPSTDHLGGGSGGATIAQAASEAFNETIGQWSELHEADDEHGIKAYFEGVAEGICFGIQAGSNYINFLNELVAEIDPIVPVAGVGLGRGLRRPAERDRMEVRAAEAGPLAGVSAPQVPQQKRVQGRLDLHWTGATAFPGGAIVAEGVLLDADGMPIANGPLSVPDFAGGLVEGTVDLRGDGSVVQYGDGPVAGRFAAYAADLTDVRVDFFGAPAPGEPAEALTLLADVGTLSGGGALPLPATVDVAAEEAALQFGPTGYDGFTGMLSFAPAGLQVAGAAEASLSASVAPAALALGPGVRAALLPRFSASEGGDHTWIAHGPAGWDVSFDDATLRVRPGPGAAAGAYLVHVWVASAARPRLTAGVSIPVQVLGNDGGVSVRLTHRPLVNRFVDHAPAPLELDAEITNHGLATRTFTLTGEAPAGFAARVAVSTLTLGSGEVGAVRVFASPQAPLPPPGGPVTVRLHATAGAVTGAGEATIAMPAFIGALLTMTPRHLSLEPGQTAATSLTIEPRGNAPGRLSFAAITSNKLAIAGVPASLDLTPGVPVTVPLQVTLAADATVGLPYNAMIRATREAPGRPLAVSEVSIYTQAIGHDAHAAVDATDAASDAGRTDFARSLAAVIDDLDRLDLRCTDDGRRRLANTLRTVSTDLTDPVFADLRDRIRAFSFALDAGTCAALDTAPLQQMLGDLATRIREVAAFDFALTLTPEVRVVDLAAEAAFSLRIERKGAQAPSVRLELLDVPGDLASPVAPAPLIAAHPLVVRAPGQGRFPFRVRATVEGAPGVSRVVSGLVVAEPEAIRIVEVGVDPPLPLPGARLSPFVRLFNVANVPQDLLAEAEVFRPDGSLLFRTAAPVPLRVPVKDPTARFVLGDLQTFGEPEGVYRVRVVLRAVAGGPVLDEREGTAYVGVPILAAATAEPSPLPPGDVTATVAIDVKRRPREVIPGVPTPEEIERYTSTADGPIGLAVGPDNSIYVSNFGEGRNIPEGSPGAGSTVSRIAPDGTVSLFAVTPEAPVDMTIGPDGAIYVTNAGPPESITRISLPDGAVTSYFDFANPPAGSRRANNPLGIAFDSARNAYVAELYDLMLFGTTIPGTLVYKVTPDGNGDGRGDASSIYENELESPTRMIIDPRNQNLIVCDAGHDRVVTINTVGTPVATQALLGGFPSPQGLVFDAQFNLYVLDHERGDIRVWPTANVNGRTTITGPETFWMGGLTGAITLVFDRDGNMITTQGARDEVVRIRTAGAEPRPVVSLDVDHRTTPGADPTSGQPDLGGPNWDIDRVTWQTTLAPADEALRFSYRQPLADLRPGQVRRLSEGTTVTYVIDGASVAVELPPVEAIVDHLVGLSPDRVDLHRNSPQAVTIVARNHRAVADTVRLSVSGLPPHVTGTLAASELVVPANGQATTTLTLVAEDDAVGATTRYTVTAESVAGGRDAVGGEIAVPAGGLFATLEPPERTIQWGEDALYTVRVRNTTNVRTQLEGVTVGLADVAKSTRIGAPAHETRERTVFFNVGPNETVTTQLRFTPLAGPGSYPFNFRVYSTDTDDPPMASLATGRLNIESGRDVSLRLEPASIAIPTSNARTVYAVIRNEGDRPASYALTGTNQASWARTFPVPGPYLVQPGEEVRVPMLLTSSNRFSNDWSYTITATDVDAAAARATADGFVDAVNTARPRFLVSPVAAANGRATMTIRVEREGGAGAIHDYVVEAFAPGATDVVLSATRVNLTAINPSSRDVTVTLHGLANLGPGPWPVLARIYPVSDPTLTADAQGRFTVPGGGLSVAWEEDAVSGRAPVDAGLFVSNLDFGAARSVDVAFASLPAGLGAVAPETAFSLPAGARVRVPVRIGAADDGQFVLRATGSAAGVAAASDDLQVTVEPDVPPNRAPVANAGGPYATVEGAPVQLDGTASGDADGTALTYGWDLDDDGAFDDSTEARPFATFGAQGAYRVRLQVSDGSLTAEDDAEVAVADAAPTAAFDFAPGTPIEGGEVAFTDTSTTSVDALTSWLWDFGDGGGSNVRHPRWRYQAQGRYSVTLTVRDADGSTSSVTRAVDVSDSAPVAALDGPGEAIEGRLLRYSAAGSSAGLDPIETYEWDFDYDGAEFVPAEEEDGVEVDHTFADDGAYVVAVRVTDRDGSTSIATIDVEVEDAAPTAAFTFAPAAPVEGDPVAFIDESTSPADDVVGFAWTFAALDGSASQHPSFAFAQDGTYAVCLTVTDEDGSADSACHDVLVANAAPVVSIDDGLAIDEGGLFEGAGAFVDPGADPWTATVDYGDGSAPEALTLGGNGFALAHVYADDGTFEVTVSVRDDDATGSATAFVVVHNVAPSVAAGDDATVPEGAVFAGAGSFSDPGLLDTHVATVDYGDGIAGPLALDGHTFALSHVYADEGLRTVTVAVTDDEGDTGTDTLTVRVENVAPTVNAGNDARVEEGAVFAGAGSFRDPGADHWTATVDYGDGTPAAPLALAPDKTFALGHAYADDGRYEVAVVVHDGDGGRGIDTLTVEVGNVAPRVDAGADTTGECAEPVALRGSFTDAGRLDTHEATADWGDGSGVEELAVDQAADRVAGQHTYAATGRYDAVLNVLDDDGGWGADTVAFQVGDTRAPSLTCPADVGVDADATCRGRADALAARAVDACRGEVRLIDDRRASYPLGRTLVTFAATDAAGNRATCQTTVKVTDRTAPLADAGPDQPRLEAGAGCRGNVTVDGRASHDNCGITSYRWTDAGRLLAEGPLASFPLAGMSEHVVTLTACDAAGACDTDETRVRFDRVALACSHVTRVNARSTGEHLMLDGVYAPAACAALDLPRAAVRLRVDEHVYEVPAGGLSALGNSGRLRYTAPRRGNHTWTFTVDRNDGAWTFDGRHVPRAGLNLGDGVDLELALGDQVARQRVPLTRRGNSAEYGYDAPRGTTCAAPVLCRNGRCDDGDSDHDSDHDSDRDSDSDHR